ncbi:hypothetical protein ASE66_20765 [Bosea sp. Root483D1]|uniref:hypothetical protein n=1 Tax=Bosea sp. Root483D1 TaxID=1736544 RepID=UPI00070C5F65|nr:hypothetical protein [Bosea sp. Root483D1]KRE12915.1 hypothetical protein ASE66_20765 [Bosea sp. Root483D1]
MSRSLVVVGLTGLGLIAATAPAAAFWPRSQWRVCSEGTTAAEYQRWRCWELDGYAGEIAPAFNYRPGLDRRGPAGPRSGRGVSRLG